MIASDVLGEQDVSPKANELFKEDSVNLLRDGSGLFQVVKSPTSSQITKGPKNQQRNRMGQVVAGVPTVEVGLRVFGFGGQLLELRMRQPEFVAGLLVVKDGHVVFERYGLGNTPETKWISFSVAKSVVSMLVGAAIKDGFIASVDEPVTDYLPRLKGSSYDRTSIRDLMQMASGVLWNEDYDDPNADINQVPFDALGMHA